MSYIVLARKWRPMVFEDVIGQEHITRTLVNALQQNRIAHAFIFSGPRGVGKTTTARLLAKAVNCLHQPAANPCNQCENCLAVTSGTDLDVIEIDGASNRGIDEIRNLRENIRFAPASATHKIYIIDEVHMLSKEAFNALLKTLEEPPSHAIFIFATTEIHKVPITILSRCQRFDFKRIPANVIADQLQRIAEGEKINVDRESLLLIARKADGGMRDATSILDQLVSFSAGGIDLNLVRESLGLIGEEVYFRFTDMFDKEDNAGVLAFAGEVFHQGYDLLNFVQGLEEHFRNILMTRASGSAAQIETAEMYRERYADVAKTFNEKDLLHYLDILTKSEETLKFSPNPLLYFELLLLKLSNKPSVLDIQELLQQLGGLEKKKDKIESGTRSDEPAKPPEIQKPNFVAAEISNPAPPEKPLASSPPPEAASIKLPGFKFETPPPEKEAAVNGPAVVLSGNSIDLDVIKSGWQNFLANIKKKGAGLAISLQEAVPFKLTDDQLEIAFDEKNGFQLGQVERQLQQVERTLQETFSAQLRLSCKTISFAEKGIEKQVLSPEEAFENLKSQEPLLKKIIDLFDCENLED